MFTLKTNVGKTRRNKVKNSAIKQKCEIQENSNLKKKEILNIFFLKPV